ncbi:MAG TPA: hypothetical protein PKZ44_10245 [Flavobacterium sp.]|nr:hypothetical protein [Flavobacterium sp.]
MAVSILALGLWIVGPLFLLVGLSVLFAGEFQSFIKNDLPILLVALVASGVGGFLLAKYKNKAPKEL